MKKILPIIIAVIALGGVYKFVIAKPKTAAAKPKVDGNVYILGKEFLVNLADGRYAKLTVALVLDPKDTSTVAKGGETTTKVPELPPKKAALPNVKELVSLRIDQDVLEHFQEGGPGWQDRINDALRKGAGKD